MILQYIEKALSHARYEIIEDRNPYYGEVPELPGVWATGPTLEECRKNLIDVIEGWIIVRLKRGLPIPPIDNYTIDDVVRMENGVKHKITPVPWNELVRKPGKTGFEGPYQGGKHPYMIKGELVLTIPNPHPMIFLLIS